MKTVRIFCIVLPTLAASACGGEGDPALEEVEAMVCRDLQTHTRATLQRGFPDGWSIQEAQIVMAPDILSREGAPSEVVAARVLDAEGNLYAGTPVLWVIEGGTEPRFETLPKSYMLLNEASRDLMELIVETGTERGQQFRYWSDATSPNVGWSLDHPATLMANECLEQTP